MANSDQTPTHTEGKRMPVINHVPRLVRERKFDGGEINMSTVAADTGLNYVTVQKWLKDRVDMARFEILEIWCQYLDCKVGDLLEYRP